MDQLMLGLTGGIAIWLTQDDREEWRRYACLFGIAGQPFWMYTSWVHGQWGIFILSAVYGYAWYKGVRLHWLKPRERKICRHE